jgi:hypothetical protein
MSGGWVYIMTNRPNGVLYTGVTSDIGRRAYEHREGLVPGFTKRYGLKRLVYMEFHERVVWRPGRGQDISGVNSGPASYRLQESAYIRCLRK